MAKITDADLLETIRLLRKHNGDRSATGRDLHISPTTVGSRVATAKVRGIWPDDVPDRRGTPTNALEPEVLAASVEAVERHGGNVSAAAAAMGISRSTMQKRMAAADIRTDWVPQGATHARKATPRALPQEGSISRYILTCAQSETKLHDPTWRALEAAAGHLGAELMVATFSYKHTGEGSAKRGTAKITGRKDWYDTRIEPYVVDDMVQLAPSLIWNGHINILPTAVNPLSGMANYNARSSSVFPHAKVAMVSIPTVRQDAAKLQFTTGTATLRNYIQKKAGQKAEFDHVYGAMLVEVDSDGRWWARQLITDARGYICDAGLGLRFSGAGAEPLDGVEAIVWGDVHVAQLEDTMRELNWGRGGILDTLKPRVQMMHDVLDFAARSHHKRKDPFQMFDMHVSGKECVRSEIQDVGGLLDTAYRPWCTSVMVIDNHSAHLDRWVKEADWKEDPVNAEFYTEAAAAWLRAIRARKEFNPLKWAISKYCPVKKVRWLRPDESMVICRDSSGGIEMGLHGDRGPNGSRGSLANLSRLGRKVCIGHSHSAGIFNGAWQTGVTARLDMDYAVGSPSSWSHSHVVVHRNGKRQMITCFDGKWRA